jgi:hypothetical protein
VDGSIEVIADFPQNVLKGIFLWVIVGLVMD